MGRRFSLLLAAAFTIVLALAGAAQAATLSGTLERVRIDQPIPVQSATATVIDPTTQRAVATAYSDAAGAWSATVPDGVYDVEYAYSGHRAERVASVLAYGDLRLGTVEFVLNGWARVRGVVSAQGSPVERAAVTLCATTYTDSAGNFRIDCPQGDQRLTIGSGDWTVRADAVPLAADRSLDVRVPVRMPLTVRVLDAEDQTAIADAQVALPELSSPFALADDVVGAELRTAERSEATNAAGEAAFTIFPSARGYGTITAPTPRHGDGWFSVADADANGVVEQTLMRLAHVSGTIADANGPRAGVTVGGREDSRRTVTGAEGNFSVWVWPTEQFIVVDPDSGSWYSVDLDRSEDRHDVRLMLPRREQLEIRVVDGDGAPVEGATVEPPYLETRIDWGGGLYGSGGDWFSAAVTDRGGVVRFEALVGARTSTWSYGRVTPPAGSTLQRTAFAVDGTSTTVTLTDQPGRFPVYGYVNVGWPAAAEVTLDGVTRMSDGNGYFTAFARAGENQLHASWSAGGSAWEIDGSLDVFDGSYLLLAAQAAPVTVHVRDADGEPVAGATVELPRHVLANAFRSVPGPQLAADPAPIVTGADGDAVANVPAGGQPQTVATVTAPGARAPQTFRLDADGETTVTLAPAPRPVHVSGTIASNSGRPVEGISVGGSTSRTLTAADGSFAVDVDPGEEFSVSWPRSADRYVAELDLSEDRVVNLGLPRQQDWHVARVVDRSGAPVVGATVELSALATPFDFGNGIAGRAIEHRTATVDSDGWARTPLTYDGGEWRGGGTVTVTPPAGSRLPSVSGDYEGIGQTFVLDDEPGLVLFEGFIAMGRMMSGVPISLGDVSSTTDDDGDFRLVVPAGRHQLHAEWQEEDGGDWQLDGPIELNDHTTGNFRSGWTPATVHVRDAQGEPVAGATVELPVHTASGEFRWFAPDVTLSATPAPTVTGADGDAVARVPWNSAPQGEATVTAPGARTPQSFRLDPDGETTVTLAPQTAVVSGVVVEADGSPSTRVLRVLVDNTGTSSSRPASFTRTVSFGEHQLRVNGTDFTLEGSFAVTGDRTLTVRLPPVVSLSVRALGGGRAIAGASVVLPWTEVVGAFGELGDGRLSEYRSGETGADGIATFDLSAGATAQSLRRGFVLPPEGSGYDGTSFDLPPLDRDASIDVPLAGGPVSAGPQIELAVTPDPLVRGDWWSVSRVAVQVTASDDDGVASLACSVDGVARTFTQTRTATTRGGTFYVNAEGRHTAACTAVDGGGRTASQERAINLDLKNPAAPTASADRAADNVVYGWWRDSVTVSFADNGDPLLADGSAGSGVDPASVTAPLTYDRSGTYTASGTVADRSGRVSAAGRVTVKVDADAPTSTLTCPANPVTLGGTGSARWQDADGQSGLAGGATGSVALDTSAIGSFEATHAAVDRVGHTTTSTCRYRVVYAFAWRGNLQAAPALNAIAPGVSTQTVWFSIGGDQGRDPIVAGSPQVEPIDCASGAPSGRATTAALAGSLVWDAVNGRYGIPWNVAADLPSGSCAALRLQLVDGVEREVRFAR